MDPEDLLPSKPVAAAVYGRVRSCLGELGPFEVRTTKSQIAFRRKRGFAYLWLPGQYLSNADAEVVLSIALGRHDPSERFKEVAHPHRAIGCTTSRSMDPMRWMAMSSNGSAKPSNVLADSHPCADRGQDNIA
ncbi:MAG: DUF5655 domain-containing protein [Dehalococcoidia bacterium]|nr:DUF5655 domain-containing protein [Dehalococcoidia bacterium]